MGNITKIAILLIILLMVSYGVFSMSIMDTGKVCLFSKMTGVINMNGKPAANVRLVRTVDFEKKETDETVTDENGNFEFPAVHKRAFARLVLPMQFVVGQTIIAHFEGKEYRLWHGVKSRKEENTESRGKPLVVACDLANEENDIGVDGDPFFSLCSWDVEPDPKRDPNMSFFDTSLDDTNTKEDSETNKEKN